MPLTKQAAEHNAFLQSFQNELIKVIRMLSKVLFLLSLLSFWTKNCQGRWQSCAGSRFSGANSRCGWNRNFFRVLFRPHAHADDFMLADTLLCRVEVERIRTAGLETPKDFGGANWKPRNNYFSSVRRRSIRSSKVFYRYSRSVAKLVFFCSEINSAFL